MAKGDHKRMQNEIEQQKQLTQYGYGYSPGGYGTTNPKAINYFQRQNIQPSAATPGVGGMENLTRNLYGSNQQFAKNYETGVAKNLQSYDDIMEAYRNFLGRNSAAAGTFGQMASDGGGINADAIRNRAMSGVRAVYSNAKRNLGRQRAIQGGYSPGYTTALTRMAREQGQNVADASTDVEAAIADLVSRNRLAGAGGLANLEGMDLSTINAMGNLFGTSPGLASTFGNQLLSSEGNLLQGQSLANQLAQIMMNARAQNAQIPGNFQQAMGNIGSVLGLGGRLIGSMVGLGGGMPTGANMPVNAIPNSTIIGPGYNPFGG